MTRRLLGQGSNGRPFAIGPASRADRVEPVHGRDARRRSDRDQDEAALELSRSAARQRDADPARAFDVRRAPDCDRAVLDVVLLMGRVVGVVDAFAVDHPVAKGRCLLPRKVATRVVDRGRVQQRLRGHAGPVRARTAEQVALDDRDRLTAPPCLAQRGLARRTRADDHEVEPLRGAGRPCSPRHGHLSWAEPMRWRRSPGRTRSVSRRRGPRTSRAAATSRDAPRASRAPPRPRPAPPCRPGIRRRHS